MGSFFEGKKILIVCGTGTIGQNLLRYLLRENPAVVRILSRDEYKQFLLQQEFRDFTNIRYLIGDVRDAERVLRAMQDIDYVFHVAAMKHVPACEYNPFEAVQTNIIGTQNIIQASLKAGVKKTVFTSTDKAIAPTNTYGASKLMAERLIASAQYHTGPNGTVFAAVRFGNVMGSRGSVIPLFKSQIKEKGSITITDPEMSRFMMTIKQATELTVEALKRAQGGEVFVLKMPVVNLGDLASIVIEELSTEQGYRPEEIKIEQIGIRPGEKMYEELMTVDEAKHALELPDMFVIPNLFLGRDYQYSGSRPILSNSYNSANVTPVAKAEIRTMLKESGLL